MRHAVGAPRSATEISSELVSWAREARMKARALIPFYYPREGISHADSGGLLQRGANGVADLLELGGGPVGLGHPVELDPVVGLARDDVEVGVEDRLAGAAVVVHQQV